MIRTLNKIEKYLKRLKKKILSRYYTLILKDTLENYNKNKEEQRALKRMYGL